MWRGLTAAALAAPLALGVCSKGATEADKKEDKGSGPGIALSANESKSLGTARAPAVSHRARVLGFGVAQLLESEA
ncbi:MAG TPA: hypothetical protein VNW15_15625 [Rhizomicrobium sp.]|jgi:hypothetical protein|nr:hypothetical protein [Rhizomicrobium sp.]